MQFKKGRKGLMAIKVDLEKAYDRLDWNFVHDTLNEISIPSNLKNVIMQYITSSTMQILWNGEPTNSFIPGRGVRQGDPLSPYIFILCIERLAHGILKEVNKGNWKPIRMGRNGIPISHLFFLMIFFYSLKLQGIM